MVVVTLLLRNDPSQAASRGRLTAVLRDAPHGARLCIFKHGHGSIVTPEAADRTAAYRP
jgi:hypothetical protein